MFTKIAHHTPDITFCKIHEILEHTLFWEGKVTEEQLQIVESGLQMIVKDIELHQYSPVMLVVGLWESVLKNPDRIVTKEQIIQFV